MSYWQPGYCLDNGRYVIQKQLGEGGFAVTYLALDRVGHPVVIKTLKQFLLERWDYQKFKEDFYNEAIALAKCKHSHIVPVIKILIQGEFPCIVMKYINGESLADKINNRKNQGFIPEVEALGYIKQIGEALRLVHENDLLHRDVKPHNIIIQSQDNKAVLIDFGIARYFQPEDNESLTAFRSYGYAPIEQYDSSGQYGYHSDVYALAATLYFTLTNTTPAFAHLRIGTKGDCLIPPQQINPLITDKVNYAILKGMGIYPEERSPSIQSWLSLLEDNWTQNITPTKEQRNISILSSQLSSQNTTQFNTQNSHQNHHQNRPVNIQQNVPFISRNNPIDSINKHLEKISIKKFTLRNKLIILVTTIPLVSLGIYQINLANQQTSQQTSCKPVKDYVMRCHSMKDVPIDVENGIQEITFGGSTTLAKLNTPEIINKIKTETNNKLPFEYKKLPGSSYGITQLVENRLHFGLSSLSITIQQKQIAAELGFRLQEEKIGYNALSIIVNPQLTEKLLKQLTLQQVQDIFTGKINNWKDVDGPNLKIKLIRRKPQPKTITTDIFQAEVLKDEDYSQDFKFVVDNDEMKRTIKQTPGSIGYNTVSQFLNSSDIRILPIAKDNKSIAVTPCLNLKCDKINRNLFTENQYPPQLIHPLYIVIKMNNGLEQKAGYAYVNIMLSDEGQKIIEEAGFLPFYNQPLSWDNK
jgi:serine/threonine protein kinase